MLNNIPKIISPELIKILMEMGHGDEIVIGDGNFPAANYSKRLVRCDGHNVSELLDAILKLFPLDSYSEFSASLMEITKGDPYDQSVPTKYEQIIKKYKHDFKEFGHIERFKFYELSKKAYAVISTSDQSLYANIILKKGIVE